MTHPSVTLATVVQTECEAKKSRNKRSYKLISGTRTSGNLRSPLFMIIINLFYTFYALMMSC